MSVHASGSTFELASVRYIHLLCAVILLTSFVATAGGKVTGYQMPWITMASGFGKQRIQMREWAFSCPFPTEGKKGKGVESLSVADQILLKDAFAHPINPITFHRIEDSDAHREFSNNLSPRLSI